MPKNFDHIFRKSLDKLEAPVGPEAWEQLFPHLPRKKRRRLLIPWLGGLLFALCFILPLSTYDSYSEQATRTNPTNSRDESPIAEDTPTPILRPKPVNKLQLLSTKETSSVSATVERQSTPPAAVISSFSASLGGPSLRFVSTLSVDTVGSSSGNLSPSLFPLKQPSLPKQLARPWRFHLSLSKRHLYQHLWPNQQDQIVLTGFQPAPAISSNRLSGSLELGISRSWRKNFAWEASLFLAHFQHLLLFDQISYGTYAALDDPNSPNGKISLTPKPIVQSGITLDLSGWTWGGGLKASWTPDRHRLSVGIRYRGQYVKVLAENQTIVSTPALTGGRWQTLIQYDYQLVDFASRWGLSIGPELGYTLGIQRSDNLPLGVQPYWWGIRLTLSKRMEPFLERRNKQ
ncbi:MAG: hypothetical protein AAGM67_00575 [Bacteroidota bacterium]